MAKEKESTSKKEIKPSMPQNNSLKTSKNQPSEPVLKTAAKKPVARMQESPKPNFYYSFERNETTVIYFEVEDFQQDKPNDTGTFYTPILDPGATKHIQVVVIARQDLPAGSASLNLKYMGKDVYDPPRDLDFNNGIGGINETVKLP
jgi:hypothetical protein